MMRQRELAIAAVFLAAGWLLYALGCCWRSSSAALISRLRLHAVEKKRR